MEEQILKMINGTPEKSAKEITSMMLEFIEWLTMNTMRATTYSLMFYNMQEFKPDTSKEWYIDELFEYWINIRKP